MKLSKVKTINIDVMGKKREQCGACDFIDHSYGKYVCYLYNEILLHTGVSTETGWPLRSKKCMKEFGETK